MQERSVKGSISRRLPVQYRPIAFDSQDALRFDVNTLSARSLAFRLLQLFRQRWHELKNIAHKNIDPVRAEMF